MAAQPKPSPAPLPEVPLALLISLFERAAAQLRILIRTHVISGAKGSAAVRRRQLATVDRILSALRVQTEGLIAAGILEAGRAGGVSVDEALRTRLGDQASPLLPSWSGVDTAAIQALAAASERKLSDAIGTVGRQTRDVFERVGREEVTTGLIAGRTRRETSAAVKARLAEEEGLTCFVDKAGRRWKLDVYSKMVARTTSREASTRGVIERMRQAELDLVQVSSHTGPCDICKRFDGRIYSLSGASEQYPLAEAFPPYHPNCRHVLTPGPVIFTEDEPEVAEEPPIEPELPAGDPRLTEIAEMKETMKHREELRGAFANDFEERGQRIAEMVEQDEDVRVLTDRVEESQAAYDANVTARQERMKELHKRLEQAPAGIRESERLSVGWLRREESNDPEMSRLRNESRRLREDLEETKKRVVTARRNVTLSVLRLFRPYGNERFDLSSRRGKTIRDHDEAVKLLPDDWIKEANQRSPDKLELRSHQGRAHYEPRHDILQNAPRVNTRPGAEGRPGDISTMLHELAHHLQHYVNRGYLYPGDGEMLSDLEADFYRQRTHGEDPQRIGQGYGSDEVTRPDDFANRYVGKDYGSRTRASEILTTGLEGVFFDRYSMRTKDPGMYHFILGLLALA